jgi:hypothetical protein
LLSPLPLLPLLPLRLPLPLLPLLLPLPLLPPLLPLLLPLLPPLLLSPALLLPLLLLVLVLVTRAHRVLSFSCSWCSTFRRGSCAASTLHCWAASLPQNMVQKLTGLPLLSSREKLYVDASAGSSCLPQ